jgi:hypothetical protein
VIRRCIVILPMASFFMTILGGFTRRAKTAAGLARLRIIVTHAALQRASPPCLRHA